MTTARKTADARIEVASDDDVLAVFLARYPGAKRAATDANDVFESIKLGIKLESNIRHPEAATIDLHSKFMADTNLRVTWTPTTRFNKTKAEQMCPGIIAACTEPGSGKWEVREL